MRSIKLPRGPPMVSGITPVPWSALLPLAPSMMSFMACCSRVAISHSTRNRHNKARQKSAKATFQAPPWASSSCLRPPRLMTALSCLSCLLGGFSTTLSCSVRIARRFERVDPAFQQGKAGLDIQLDQAAAGVDRQQRRLPGHVGDQHDLDAFHGRTLLVDKLFHHVADRVEHAVGKENTDK